MRRKILTGVERERGAAMVEFALLLPLFMTLVLGMFTGGLAYNQKLSVTHASREGTRYGATLPLSNFASTDDWLTDVAGYVRANAAGELNDGQPGWRVCVAYVAPGGATRQRVADASGVAYANTGCFSDGRPLGEKRVQVEARRDGEIQLLFWTYALKLESESVARFEPTS